MLQGRDLPSVALTWTEVLSVLNPKEMEAFYKKSCTREGQHTSIDLTEAHNDQQPLQNDSQYLEEAQSV